MKKPSKPSRNRPEPPTDKDGPEIRRPPRSVWSVHPVGTELTYRGQRFLRGPDGVHLIFGLPTHPAPADWEQMSSLALSFDGYGRWESLANCATVARRVGDRHKRTGKVGGTLAELRTALFFLQRSYRHMGWPPTEKEMAYPRAIVAMLRARKGDEWIREKTARLSLGLAPETS